MSEPSIVSNAQLRELAVELRDNMRRANGKTRQFTECILRGITLDVTLDEIQGYPERDPVRAAWAFEARRLTEELRIYGGVL